MQGRQPPHPTAPCAGLQSCLWPSNVANQRTSRAQDPCWLRFAQPDHAHSSAVVQKEVHQRLIQNRLQPIKAQARSPKPVWTQALRAAAVAVRAAATTSATSTQRRDCQTQWLFWVSTEGVGRSGLRSRQRHPVHTHTHHSSRSCCPALLPTLCRNSRDTRHKHTCALPCQLASRCAASCSPLAAHPGQQRGPCPCRCRSRGCWLCVKRLPPCSP